MENRLFIYNEKEKWESRAKKNYEFSQCDYKIIENGYILPLREIESTSSKVNRLNEGGVQSESGKFVAGHKRDMSDSLNMSVVKTYPIEENVRYDDRTVVYGGLLIDIFGHCITEVLSRLWYVIDFKQNLPIVFLTQNTNKEIPNYFFSIMELLGVNKERIIIAKEIVQYKKIIVPDQALVLFVGFNKKMKMVYDQMTDSALRICNEDKKNNRKIYLSRSLFPKKDCFNEEWFEEFYKKRGYDIIYPETLPLYEQIAVIAGAQDVVCTAGTLSHLLLFASEGTKATILLRQNEDGALAPQFLVNQLKQIDVSWVDVSCNILPTTHAGGVFLIGPTREFKDYLCSNKIKFDENEINIDFDDNVLWRYIQAWLSCYSKNGYAYKRLKNIDFFDFVNNMSSVIKRKSLSRKDMETPNKDKRIVQLEKIEKQYGEEIKKLQHNQELFDDLIGQLEKNILNFKEKKKAPFLVWQMHVAHKGWIEPISKINTNEIAFYSGNQLEALKIEIINSNGLNINYSVCKENGGWTNKVNMGEIAGSVGKANALKAIKLELVDENRYDILYRVGYESEWSVWYKNGEKTNENIFPHLERVEMKLLERH